MFNVHHTNRIFNKISIKKQDAIKDQWLTSRLHTVLVKAMKQAQLSMWVVVSEENNDDPVVESLTPTRYDCTRRLAIFVYYLDETTDTVERYCIAGKHPGLVDYYEFIWDPQQETQWERLALLVNEKQPKNIGINQSEHYPEADGLTYTNYLKLAETLGDEWVKKFTSAEALVTHWFLQRAEEEMTFYPFLADMTQNLAKTILSNEVIHPGITTTEEVVEWIRQRVSDLGLKNSFYPTIDVQRKGAAVDRLTHTIIQPGDIVHLDFGLDYLDITTDMQQLAYVLKPGELEAPAGLQEAFKQALQMEDIVLERIKPGRTGNDIFDDCMKEADKQSIKAMLYCHPTGRHVHEIGPNIGKFDQQHRIPHSGDLKIIENSAYVLEFNIKAYIPEWEQETYLYLEQPIAVYDDQAKYLTPRQESFFLIR